MPECFKTTTNVSTFLEWKPKGLSNQIMKPVNINLGPGIILYSGILP